MPSRKNLRVISGGRPMKAEPSAEQRDLGGLDELWERSEGYRLLLADRPNDETASLVTDMEDAIKTLERLEQSHQPEAGKRAKEYRHLIAEIDAEIAAALQIG